MNTQIKNIETVEDFIVATIEVNGVEFEVTAPIENKSDWAWVGDDNWTVTEANAEKVGVDTDDLVNAITEILA